MSVFFFIEIEMNLDRKQAFAGSSLDRGFLGLAPGAAHTGPFVVVADVAAAAVAAIDAVAFGESLHVAAPLSK